jgi:BirA family biotin operon repressor/biotin-[acetyl-CoA-carboxylase] ligase
MIIGSKILRFKILSSTNSHAKMLIRDEEAPEGTVVLSSFQTGGRGQTGNKWESEKGKNLLFSIILYPSSVNPEEQFSISMAVSLGICDFLDSKISNCKIKWPNDIYVSNDKIAGILIENSLMGETIESCVAGIGLNINQEVFSPSVLNPGSLKLATGMEYDTNVCLKELLNELDMRYRELLYGDRKKLRKEYISRLYRLNEYHSFKAGKNYFKARITGISGSGLLQIEKDNGSKEEYSFKEVEYVF